MTVDAPIPAPRIYHTLHDPGIVFKRTEIEGAEELNLIEIRQIGQNSGRGDIFYAIVPAECKFDEKSYIEFDHARVTITAEGGPSYDLVEISEDDEEFPDDPVVLRVLLNNGYDHTTSPDIVRVKIEHRATGTLAIEEYDLPFEDLDSLRDAKLAQTTILFASRILTPKICGECPVQQKCKPHRNAILDAINIYNAGSPENLIPEPDSTPSPDARN